jgi:hypothetical protein
MEDDPEGMAHPGTDAAYSMPELDPVAASGSRHRPVMHGENNSIPATQRNDLDTALHAWALLGQDKLSPREILAWLGQQDRDLQREGQLAVQILMKTVVVALHVLEQQWRGPHLPRGMACLQKFHMLFGIAPVYSHTLVPAVRGFGKVWIKRA